MSDRDRMIDPKEYAAAMRKEAVRNENGIIQVSPELWEQIASLIERSIIPPCNVGDTVYYILDGTINKAKVEERYFNDSKHGYYSSNWIIYAYDRKNKVEISFSPKDMSDTLLINGELVDITVFLSREKAEKALKKKL